MTTDDADVRTAAIRETFEETGLDLALDVNTLVSEGVTTDLRDTLTLQRLVFRGDVSLGMPFSLSLGPIRDPITGEVLLESTEVGRDRSNQPVLTADALVTASDHNTYVYDLDDGSERFSVPYGQ